MSPTDRTPPGQTEAIAFEFDLPQGPATVWRALTDPALLSRWLLPVTGFAPTPGTAFTYRTDPMPGWDGVVDCVVLESEPLHRLRYRWIVGDLDTVVTFTLTPTDTGTRVMLVQSGFRPDQKQNFGGARYGWRMMGGRLLELLDTLDGTQPPASA